MIQFKKLLGFKHKKSGFNHWWGQRFTTVLLILTGPWLLTLLLQNQPFSYEAARTWFQNPLHALLSLIFILSLLLDFYLSLVTIVNDYIHEDTAHKIIIVVLRWGTICVAGGYMLVLALLQQF